MDAKPKLLEQLRERIRARHYSYRTEKTYCHWVRRFILFHGKRHPSEMAAPEVEAFLSHLATERDVSASTQAQALAAILFLYKDVLARPLPWLENVVRAKRPTRLPTVLTPEEARRVLGMVCDLYALSVIEDDKAWFIEHRFLSTERAKAVTRGINERCRTLRPHAQDLVDGFGIPESLRYAEMLHPERLPEPV